MPAFQFRLERVLRWQVKVCRLEEESTRQCRLALTEGEERIAQLRAESTVVEQQLLDQHTITASDLKALGQYRFQVLRRGRELEIHRRSAFTALEEQMGKLVSARRQLRRLETLHDRALSEHKLALDRTTEALALESHLARRVSS